MAQLGLGLVRLRGALRGIAALEAACVDCQARMDFGEWLGAEVTIGQKTKKLPDRVADALQKVWDEGVLEEDDIPEEDSSLDDVQLEHDLRIVQRAFVSNCLHAWSQPL